LVVIELKRDDSGSNVDWQAIRYASYCSNLSKQEIITIFTEYLESEGEYAEARIEQFIDADDFESLNNNQRIILVSKNFHSDVVSSVLWLRDFSVEIECVKISPFLDSNGTLYLTSDKIIPLPEAKDYIIRKERKQKEYKTIGHISSSFSMEKSDYANDKLKSELKKSLQRPSDLTPRIIIFLQLLLTQNKKFTRDEIKEDFVNKGITTEIGQAGRLLSGVSQFITKKSTPHFRQILDFEGGGGPSGQRKNHYIVLEKYRTLLQDVLDEILQKDK
jgi:transposase